MLHLTTYMYTNHLLALHENGYNYLVAFATLPPYAKCLKTYNDWLLFQTCSCSCSCIAVWNRKLHLFSFRALKCSLVCPVPSAESCRTVNTGSLGKDRFTSSMICSTVGGSGRVGRTIRFLLLEPKFILTGDAPAPILNNKHVIFIKH